MWVVTGWFIDLMVGINDAHFKSTRGARLAGRSTTRRIAAGLFVPP
jgi:hypothetical protein